MALEPITRQEQIIAGKNLEPITRMERFLKEYGGSSGGGGVSVQSDWNQTDETAADFIKNKPFGDVYGDTLSWDGDTEGCVVVGDVFCKISDAAPTLADFANGAILRTLDGNIGIAPDEIVEAMDGLLIYGDGIIVVVSIAGIEFNGLAFPETGLYFVVEIGKYLPSLTITNYTGFVVHAPIDKKYLGNVFVQYDRLIYLTSGGATDTKFALWVNDRGELQTTEIGE